MPFVFANGQEGEESVSGQGMILEGLNPKTPPEIWGWLQFIL